MNPTLIKNYDAGGVIAAHRIVKPSGSADNEVVQAAAVSDALMGVADLGADASADRVDVIHAGIATVEAGGSISAGNPVTADANGKGVAAAPAAGTNNRIVGFAVIDAAAGDLFPVLIAPGQIQG